MGRPQTGSQVRGVRHGAEPNSSTPPWTSSSPPSNLRERASPKLYSWAPGPDTRAMRYAESIRDIDGDIYEFDLPPSAKVSPASGTRGSPSTAPTSYKKPSYIPYDLNGAGDPDKATPLDILTSAGFSKERRQVVLLGSRAVLCGRPPQAKVVPGLVARVHNLARQCRRLDGQPQAVRLLPSPFTHEARAFFEDANFDLLNTSARWGGAVHSPCFAGGAEIRRSTTSSSSTRTRQ